MPQSLLSRLAPAVLLLLPATAGAADPVDFARDVRPLLSNACFKCHGPAVQMGKLRLDTRDAAVKTGAIVPGSPDKSTLVERVCDPTDDGRMPPAEAAPRLTPAQVQTLKAWIAEGAVYTPHWAFGRVERPAPPATKHPARNPIDAFVFARLEKAGLAPSPEAEPLTLLRRVSLDLTGLPPTPAEVEAFVRDSALRTPHSAFLSAVDRLLASPHYGERQARHWLDLARYADSNGYTIDGPRSIWPYRDWVIRAFNTDLPFDQFTTQQLAGDLLPGATLEQKVATGFHRNTAFNEEGGTDAEQFRVERTVDRTNTTGAVWLGLTVGCAQCHTHKYDPVTQHDYFRLYAFFDSCDEPTMPIGGPPRMEDTIAKLNHMEFWLQKNGGDREDIDRVRAEVKRVQGKVTTTLVLRERPAPRPTHVQLRGDFLRKGDAVQPAFPAAISTATATKARLTRLDLARWLVSRDNPLTARVTVNREWQKFFGRGLVETENDFGMQGSLPTHPELLDWLAAEFMEGGGWSVKKLHKLIVTSATYRQASVHRADLTAADPRNLLLGRQSRLRLEAEVIRDAALAASGTLNPKVGGPGVYPPQPKEVFAFTQSQRTWPESQGPDRFRRGVYTYIWRQSQHPLMTTFDGADAQTACTKRNRSNTPLQALHLANDPVFVELATALGRRIETDGGPDDAAKVWFAFRACFARDPATAEAARVLAYLEAQRKTNPTTAWPATARVLMNLDEFITRE